MNDIAVTVRVSGRVQGVMFRAWTQAEARTLGLTGWVRNEADGSVTALLAGPEARVQEMIAGLHRGPPAARVREVEVTPADGPVPSGFAVTG